MRALAALTAAGALLCAGCGSAVTPPTERTWRANAVGLIGQLRGDVAVVEQVAPSQNPSALYALLVAYSDMAGCSTMTVATGAPPTVVRPVARACPRLERAAALFTQGERTSDLASLRLAARVASTADGQLARAALALRRLTGAARSTA